MTNRPQMLYSAPTFDDFLRSIEDKYEIRNAELEAPQVSDKAQSRLSSDILPQKRLQA